jgi:5'-nucleotidase (lipoprotein e(P4) family)
MLVACAESTTRSNRPPATALLLSQDVLATVWMQRAAEHQALYHQAFNIARDRLDLLLTQRTDSRPSAVVVDIDETVLDNSPYQAWQILQTRLFPQGWNMWVGQGTANPTPGAVAFLRYAVNHGVDVYYISNRDHALLRPTLENLRRWGFPQAEPEHVQLREDTSDKTVRRESVASTHEILLLLGDNLGDFDELFQNLPPEERRRRVEARAAEFGRRYVVLPNPMYGNWEGALYNYDWSLDPGEKVQKRLDTLRPADLP